MDHSTLARATPVPPRSPARGILRWAYTSNPFYVISADLVFVGLRLSFDTSGKTFETGALMLALLGYTLLLATTAYLLIRLGHVWDDARTILLLVVAMFLAISVTFDETLAGHPRVGTACYLGGLLFAVLVSEGLLWGIRLRLPPLFRLPYYFILALFFLYPIALTPLLGDPDSPALRWMLFGFSPLAGLVFLSLIPAVRRGPGYVSKNGSPWRYPLYPWVLFGLLAAAVCGRAFYLCISFHFVGRSFSIFGPYFLVPFLFALDLLLLEAGLVARSRATQRAALFALPGMIVLALVGQRPDPIFRGFLELFLAGLGGSPLFLTLLGSAAFCSYAACRRVPLAFGGLTTTLLALTVVAPGTLDFGGLVVLQPFPLLGVGLLQLGLALRWRDSWRCLIGAVCLIAATASGLGRTGLGAYQGFVVFHLAVIAAMVIGAVFTDPLGRVLKQAGAVLLTGSCLYAVWGGSEVSVGVTPEQIRAYPPLVILTCVGYGSVTGCRPYFTAAAVSLSGWMGTAGWHGYHGLRRMIVGLDWITCGFAFFVLAALISLGKAGLLPRPVVRRVLDTIAPPFPSQEQGTGCPLNRSSSPPGG